MMDVVHANLIDYVESGDHEEPLVVIHGSNCQCTMGAGVALDIANAWNEAFDADQATRRGDRNKLGNWSSAVITRNNKHFEVINLYTQFRYGPAREKHFDLEAFREGLAKLAIHYRGQNIRFVFPLIGTGNAGGNWRTNGPIIDRELKEFKRTLVKMPNR